MNAAVKRSLKCGVEREMSQDFRCQNKEINKQTNHPERQLHIICLHLIHLKIDGQVILLHFDASFVLQVL